MKTTPLEIRQKEFQKSLFKGYEKEEVDAYLLSLSMAWERVLDENKDLQKKLEQAEREIAALRAAEGDVAKTLKHAEDSSAAMLEQSRQRADAHLKEAQMNAEALLSDARFKAKAIAEEAEGEFRVLTDALQEKVGGIEQEYHYIENQRDLLARELENLLKEVHERVQRSASRENKAEFQAKLQEIRAHMAGKPSAIQASASEPLPSKPVAQPVKPSISQEERVVVPKIESKKNTEEGGSFFDQL